MPSAFDQILLPHLDAAYNLARWLLRDGHAAEDAVQEACLRAYRAHERFRGDDGRAWVLTIVRNVCYSHLRSVRRAPVSVDFDEQFHGVTDEAPAADAEMDREVRRAMLGAALERLPAEFREVIVLHELEGMAYREIAAVIGIPIGTVMSRLSRARQKLQTELHVLARKESSHEL